MPRLLFEKTGRAVWMSHLDLMRLFQRAFKRAGLPLTHTHGFNPRPSVSIALPLSVGVESQCELLDFALLDYDAALEEVKERLNHALVDGISVLDAYDNGSKVGNLALLDCRIILTYDKGVPENGAASIRELFARDAVTVTKKTKSGLQEQNIIPMIKKLVVTQTGNREVELHCLICCQNPTLNPAQITAAISLYLPELIPDYCKYRRMEIYDSQENVFR